MAPAPSVTELRRLFQAASGARLDALISRHRADERAGVKALVDSARARRRADRTESERLVLMYSHETRILSDAEGTVVVAGVDEVGRGSLAGPVTACACVLPLGPRIRGLDDSKRLNPARRAEVAEAVRAVAVAWSVVHVDAGVIDELGIVVALRRAMSTAIASLPLEPTHVLVDGLPMHVHEREMPIVRGDALVASIAAASVVAKVERDALMRRLDEVHPGYGLGGNKGYGSEEHLRALRALGPSPVHRRSFCTSALQDSLF